jgi:hypothetical protein
MIPKSGNRFSDKIMLQENVLIHDDRNANTAAENGGRFDSAVSNAGRSLWSCPPQTGRRGFATAAAFAFMCTWL